jgi:hypothetical protein
MKELFEKAGIIDVANKYKLINRVTGETTVCEKVTIDDWRCDSRRNVRWQKKEIDYYVSDEKVRGGTFQSLKDRLTDTGYIKVNCFVLDKKDGKIYEVDFRGNFCILDRHFLVIATNDYAIDLPKVLDEEIIAMDKLKDKWSHLYRLGYPQRPFPTNYENDLNCVLIGLYKSQEKYPFSDDAMVQFSEWCQKHYERVDNNTHIAMWKPNNGSRIWYSPYTDKEFQDKKYKLTTKELLCIWKPQQAKIIYYG